MTNFYFSPIVLAVVLGWSGPAALAQERVSLKEAAVDVLTSPKDDVGLYVVDFINKAQRRVWLAGYTFTMPEVANAVVQAKARGLDVRVVLDASQSTERYSGATFLRNGGVPVWIDRAHPIMHHKFVIVDEDRVGLGSANFTRAAMGNHREPSRSNAENFNLFVGAPQLARVYATAFEQLVAESSR